MSHNLLSHYIVLALNSMVTHFFINKNVGQVVELIPLMPHLVEVRGNEQSYSLQYYTHGKGEYVKIDVEDMVHIKRKLTLMTTEEDTHLSLPKRNLR